MSGENAAVHVPIMPQKVAHYLDLRRGGDFLDSTFGGGGHSRYFLENFPDIRLFAVDRDPEAKGRAAALKQLFGERFHFFCTTFSQIGALSLPFLRGIFFDFGVSSLQLDDPSRGFSFRYHTKLDMRMDPTRGIPAREFLETASRWQLEEAIRDCGEERRWRKIVDLILENRGSGALQYADSFAALIAENLPAKFYKKIHPATQTFQGLRIAINGELEEIRGALPRAFDLLAAGGRLVALSFHSLEDRIVKRFFNEKSGKTVDRHEKYSDRPRVATILTKRPEVPDSGEIFTNHRCRSAKLRALEKF
ncbi:MAG: 16S rRNA (cytosine(1402)-N(4))-methyltransferase RsmH [Puniceicoccales bacterium]|jgi:16S rRNA (cytosine1402-N4)-methyltransferase|nr:16S rRNA (cytosine(1402)-N(4))-methyltransferase RsmH [Puniceicoccales bacterium]